MSKRLNAENKRSRTLRSQTTSDTVFYSLEDMSTVKRSKTVLEILQETPKPEQDSKVDENYEMVTVDSFSPSDLKRVMPPLCHCVSCFEDMGAGNPRQYCCKWYCPYEDNEPFELFLIRVMNLKKSSMKKDKEYRDDIQKFIEAGDKLESSQD